MWLFVATLAVALASFYTFHRHRLEAEEKASSLPSQIDALMRRGIELRNSLKNFEPKRGESTYELFPKPATWDKVDSFYRDAFVTLQARPSLLFDYADEVNASLRKYRKKEAQLDEALKDESNFEKLMRVTEYSHSRPRAFMDAFLAGLAAARNRLGDY